MTLADQIIDSGPYRGGDSLPIEVQTAGEDQLNQLRDDLLELRRLRAAVARLSRYEVDLNRWTDPVELSLSHDCPRWYASLADSVTLAELVRRADQHTQDCP